MDNINLTILPPQPQTWQQILDEHWRQFKLAVEQINFEGKMNSLNWREYVLYDMCKRHNQEIGKELFKFNLEDQD